jgi:thioredoxin-related protein
MKKGLFILVCLAFWSLDSQAQQWQNDLQIGLKEAAQQNKKVLLFFSVPERCESCNKLERNIFKSPEFIEFASENYVLVKIDFSYDAQELTKAQLEKNLLIVEKYNKDGFFPHVVVLNKDAKITNKVDVYTRETPQQYLSLLRRNSKS